MHDKEMGALAAQVAMRDRDVTSTLVVPGCVALDTGQGTAKHITRDNFEPGPPDLAKVSFVSAVNSSRACGRGLRGHVGISLSLWACLCRLAVNYDWKNGFRLGEASHPGPSGGGARATARQRDQREQGEGCSDLAAMLRPMIMGMIREILQEILGGGGLKEMITGLLVGGQAGTSTRLAPRATLIEGDGVADELQGQRWQKRRTGGGERSENAIGKGNSAGKGQSGSENATGKSNGGENPTGRSSGDAMAKGKGKDPGSAHTKGKGADLPDGDGGGAWTVVSRRAPKDPHAEWKLRSTDWSDPVVSYDDLVVDEEQKEILTSLYRGCGKSHALLLAVLQTGSETEHCPGSVGGTLAFRQVRFTRACTPGLTAPGPKTQIKAGKVELVQSAVVYVRYVQKYLEKDVWAQALKHPQRLVLEHMARHRLKAMDCWGWSVEQAPGSAGQQQIFGKIRLPEKDVSTLLATSGAQAFFEPARSVQLGPVTTDWVPQQESETPAAYLARCLTLAAPLGLVAGRKQLGKRAPQRLWLVQMVPNAVTVEQLTTVLSHAFTDVEMVFQRRRGSTKDYTFRGKSTEQGDSLAIPLQYGTDSLVLWVRHAPPKKGPSQTQEIRTSGSWSLLGPKRPFGSEPRTGVPEAVEPSAEEAGKPDGKQVAQQPATEAADATNKRAADASEPSAKRVAGSQRALPEGATVDHVEKDGNCLFSCLAKGINLLAPDGHQLTSGEVRARLAVHLRKNEEAYVKGWDHEMPDRTKAADWGSYVTAIEGDKVWGGLTEIRAACRVWDIRCIVFLTIVSI